MEKSIVETQTSNNMKEPCSSLGKSSWDSSVSVLVEICLLVLSPK